VTTVAEWLAEREPPPPEALRRRLGEVLGPDASREAADAVTLCLAAGQRLLETVLREDEGSRDCALDLLAADALVTYAFEAACSDPATLPAHAARAMRDIASLGVDRAVGSPTARA
jgi:hypothetical protein